MAIAEAAAGVLMLTIGTSLLRGMQESVQQLAGKLHWQCYEGGFLLQDET